MRIIHLALGGCLRAPPVSYGLTNDTGGHIAYVLEAAQAQASLATVEHVVIATRLFDDPTLGPVHAEPFEPVGPKLSIVRVAGQRRAYLPKGELDSELPALGAAFLAHISAAYRRPDVVHAHFADAVQVADAALKGLNVPLIYTPHSLGLDRYAPNDRSDPSAVARFSRERHALARADRIIVSTLDEATCQVGAYGVPGTGQRVHCVPPGIPHGQLDADRAGAARILQAHLADHRRPILLAVARPDRRKNLAAIIEAYSGHRQLRDTANLVVLAGVGGGDPDGQAIRAALETSIRRAGLQRQVALPQRHTTEQLLGLYGIAAESGGVLVNASLHEPFGLTLLEAARAGLPVVATRRGGSADLVRQLRNGLLIDPLDPKGIADACWKIVSDPAFALDLRNSGRRQAAAFNWTVYARDACAIYRAASMRDARHNEKLTVSS